MNTRTLILALGAAGLGYAAYSWWKGQQQGQIVGGPQSLAPPLPPVSSGAALPPSAATWTTPAGAPPSGALVPPPSSASGKIFAAGLARIAARMGPATVTATGRGHF